MDVKIKAALLDYAKPILYSTDMVRAILEGIKTETRQIIKPQPYYFYNCIMGNPCPVMTEQYYIAGNPHPVIVEQYGAVMPDMTDKRLTPPYSTADILYVRETWQYIDFAGENNGYVYRASENGQSWESAASDWRWRPSIHMPKEAARIFLRVTGVRAEQLQDITGEGCQNEGIAHVRTRRIDTSTLRTYGADRFAALWDSTIKRADLPLYGWDANPWVWVNEFKRIEVENDER